MKLIESRIKLSISSIESLLLNMIKYDIDDIGNFEGNINLMGVVKDYNGLHFIISKGEWGYISNNIYDVLILNYEEETYYFASGGLKKLLSIKALKRLYRIYKTTKTPISDKWSFRQEKIMCRVMADISGLNYVGADPRLLDKDIIFSHNFKDDYCCVLMEVKYYWGSKMIEQDIPKYWIKFLN
jgi:hypothetical protein